MFGHLAKEKAVHSRNHISTRGAYVKKGRKNNFDQWEINQP